jgi:tetratricopeptide (TPR) repeat protein
MKSDYLPEPLIEKNSYPRRLVQIYLVDPLLVSIRYTSLFMLSLTISFSLFVKAENKPAEPVKASDSAKSAAPKKSLLDQAQESFAQKKYAEVKAILLPSLEKLEAQSLSVLARSLIELKEFHEGLRISQMLISKNEKDDAAFALAGKIQFRLKKEKEALELYKKALELNPKNIGAYEGLIELYESRKNYYELALIYVEMISRLGEKGQFLSRLCDIYTKDELYDQAKSYCNKAMLKDPSNADNYVNVGIMFRNQKEETAAEQSLKNAAEKFQKSAFAQLTYGQFLENKKDYLKSYKIYSRCLALESMNEMCLLGHGFSAAQVLKYDESLESYKKACKLNRKNAVQARRVLQILRTEKRSTWIPKYEVLVENCLSF